MYFQSRNVHGKIFGGFLMKKCYELSWVTARLFGNDLSRPPVFRFVDDIQFLRPVSIGSIMEFDSSVVYSDGTYMVVVVEVR
jgi:acyl-coenzyme A thioesterase 9